MSKQNSGDELEDILFELVYGFIPTSELRYLEQAETEQYVEVMEAKAALKKWAAQEADRAEQQLLTKILEEAREYELTDLEMLDYHRETPLVAVPASVINKHLNKAKDGGEDET